MASSELLRDARTRRRPHGYDGFDAVVLEAPVHLPAGQIPLRLPHRRSFQTRSTWRYPETLSSRELDTRDLESSTPRIALRYVDIPVMGLGYLLDDTQSETGTVPRGRVSGVKYLITMSGRNTRPIVLDVESVCQLSHCNCHVLTAVIYRIPEQIFEELP